MPSYLKFCYDNSLPATPDEIKTPRVMVMLSALLMVHGSRKMMMAVLDTSQNVHMSRIRFDGCVPTMSRGSDMFSTALGRHIKDLELLQLMGFTPARCVSGIKALKTRRGLRAMLGNTMHAGMIGYNALCAKLADILPYNLNEKSIHSCFLSGPP
jgi:hypothetical protein